MSPHEIKIGKTYLVRIGSRSIALTVASIRNDMPAFEANDLVSGKRHTFTADAVERELSRAKPIITLDGMKPGNVWHLVNRVKKALTAAHLPGGADLAERCLNRNAPVTFQEALEIVLDYVDVNSTAEPKP